MLKTVCLYITRIAGIPFSMKIALQDDASVLLLGNETVSVELRADSEQNINIGRIGAAAAAPPPHTDTLPEKIDEYIAENILNAVNLTAIAEHFDYNPFYLSRIFKKEKGVSLLDYLNDLKIKKCIELLSSGDIRIEELARKMGYSSASSFLVFFKKQTKKTPNQFRRH